MSDIFESPSDKHRNIPSNQAKDFTDKHSLPVANKKATLIKVIFSVSLLLVLFITAAILAKRNQGKEYENEVERQKQIMLAADSEARKDLEREKAEYKKRIDQERNASELEWLTKINDWQKSVEGFQRQHDLDQSTIQNLNTELAKAQAAAIYKSDGDSPDSADKILDLQVMILFVRNFIRQEDADKFVMITPEEVKYCRGIFFRKIESVTNIESACRQAKRDFVDTNFLTFLRKGHE